MSMSNLLTVGGLLALIAFVGFAFRQGMAVKPGRNAPGPTIAGETDLGSSPGHHGGDGGAGH
jgi:hypothetical protein